MESILDSVKKQLGIELDDTSFDLELVMSINSTFTILNQLAVGPQSGFSITSNIETWDQLVQGRLDLDLVKSYIYMRVRLMFDPPQNSFLVSAITDQIKEFEWRLNIQAETP